MNRRVDILPPYHERKGDPDGAAIGLALLLICPVLYFAGHFVYWWVWGGK